MEFDNSADEILHNQWLSSDHYLYSYKAWIQDQLKKVQQTKLKKRKSMQSVTTGVAGATFKKAKMQHFDTWQELLASLKKY